MAYESSTVYAKYLNKSTSSSEGGCSDCGETTTSEDCSCCPPGLIAITGDDGKHAGCVTPSDAEQYNTAKPCQPGYVKLYQNGETQVFLGCVSEEEFVTMYQAVNPVV